MKKVLIATQKPFAQAAIEGVTRELSVPGYEMLTLEKYTGKDELKAAVSKADALIVRSDIIDSEVLEAASNLKIIVRAGAGYDNIDLAVCTHKGIVAMNTPGQNANAVAELVLGMMLFHIRGRFNGETGTELRGKTIGLHGFGNVSKYVASIAKGFGMMVYAYDPFLQPAAFEKDGIQPVATIDELYRACQYVSLHIPLTDQTREMINTYLLSLMPKSAVLINTARKEIIHESSLLEMFESRNDFSYISDVFPDCATRIAIRYPGRYFFTPKKMGAQTREANNNALIAAARQIKNFFEKGDSKFKVN